MSWWRWRELAPQLTASKIFLRNAAPVKAVHNLKLLPVPLVAVEGRSRAMDPMWFL